MKKRRSLIVAFLLVAVMAIGIGYAAITGAITVNGNLSAQPEGFHVVFTDGCFDGTSAEGATYYFTDGSNGQAQELTGAYTTISVTVENLTSVDQVVKAHLVVQNNNEVTMYCTPSVVQAPDGFTIDFGDETVWGNAAAPKAVALASGATEEFTVSIKLTEAIWDADIGGNFVVRISGTAQAPDATE